MWALKQLSYELRRTRSSEGSEKYSRGSLGLEKKKRERCNEEKPLSLNVVNMLMRYASVLCGGGPIIHQPLLTKVSPVADKLRKGLGLCTTKWQSVLSP